MVEVALYRNINLELEEGINELTRYFPSTPVQNAVTVGGTDPNGGSEAWVELCKALKTMGDIKISGQCNVLKWAVAPYSNILPFTQPNNRAYGILPDKDYRDSLLRIDQGTFATMRVEANTSSFAGNIGSSCFAMGINLDTSNSGEISGVNGEEQNDITLLARWSVPLGSTTSMEVFTHFDSMIILRENNILELLR